MRGKEGICSNCKGDCWEAKHTILLIGVSEGKSALELLMSGGK